VGRASASLSVLEEGGKEVEETRVGVEWRGIGEVEESSERGGAGGGGGGRG
jgi:hypothetical protein